MTEEAAARPMRSRRSRSGAPVADAPRPTLEREQAATLAGARCVAGVDEVGRGALAGPVVAAAVVLPALDQAEGALAEVRDSKLLAPSERDRLAAYVRLVSRAVGVGAAWPQEIDALGIARATALAMRRALDGLCLRPDYVLVDGLPVRNLGAAQQEAIVRGDQSVLSIAAASLVAKTTRDAWMLRLAMRWPTFGHDAHKGYAAPGHLRAIAMHGPSREHRLSWRPFDAHRALLGRDLGGTLPARQPTLPGAWGDAAGGDATRDAAPASAQPVLTPLGTHQLLARRAVSR